MPIPVYWPVTDHPDFVEELRKNGFNIIDKLPYHVCNNFLASLPLVMVIKPSSRPDLLVDVGSVLGRKGLVIVVDAGSHPHYKYLINMHNNNPNVVHVKSIDRLREIITDRQ